MAWEKRSDKQKDVECLRLNYELKLWIKFDVMARTKYHFIWCPRTKMATVRKMATRFNLINCGSITCLTMSLLIWCWQSSNQIIKLKARATRESWGLSWTPASWVKENKYNKIQQFSLFTHPPHHHACLPKAHGINYRKVWLDLI